jgi:hypothetical protein
MEMSESPDPAATAKMPLMHYSLSGFAAEPIV